MNKELNAAVLSCIQTSGASEYDQRSAIGMKGQGPARAALSKPGGRE